ncbi:hypothetical protein [Nocardioides halotolerans]|uniref:hypothetical protein n=1 Tax=Nocardioides halotolerans TaxID=433660 RepID=UPI0004126B02|nr:hypothetical protein [Nocardioides halotolerans]
MFGVVARPARWVLLVVLALCLLPLTAQQASAQAAPAPAPLAPSDSITIHGSLNAGDVQQAGRLTRDGHTHGCEAPTPMAPLENATPLRRDTHNLQNPYDTDRCIVVEADLSGCAGNQTQVVAYSAFNPANPAAGVASASGFSTIATMRFGFRVAAGASYAIGVNEVDAGSGCPLYKLKVTNAPMASTTQGDGANGFILQATVNAFRNQLGDAQARQEITWDDVPEAAADPHVLPADYYNTVQPRGLVFTGPADIRVSSDGSGPTAEEFGDLGLFPDTHFQPFSFLRLMSPVDEPIAQVAFRVAGTNTPAPTSAFGAVFADPGTAGFLIPRAANGDPLGLYVPPAHDDGLSFYGLRFPAPVIHSMSVAGNWVNGVQATAFDNFVYADPGFRLGLAVSGPGRVTAPGLSCPGQCSATFGSEPVTLKADPSETAGVRWNGACAGTHGATCVLSLSQSQTSASATFVSCVKQATKVTKLKKKLKKLKKAVRKATTRLGQAEGRADVADARSDLIKARKKLAKAKKKLKKAKQSLQVCLG